MTYEYDLETLRILRVLVDNPRGLGFNQLASLLKDDMSKVTLKKRLDKLEDTRYLVHEIPKRKGQKHIYRLDEKYIDEIKKQLEAPQGKLSLEPIAAFEIRIKLTPEYEKTLKKRNPQLLEKIIEAQNDPLKRYELGRVLGSTFITYVEDMIGKPNYMGGFLKDDRFLIVATLPGEWGKRLKKMLDYKLFNDEAKLLELLLTIGFSILNNVLTSYENRELREGHASVVIRGFEMKNGKVISLLDRERIMNILKSKLCR